MCPQINLAKIPKPVLVQSCPTLSKSVHRIPALLIRPDFGWYWSAMSSLYIRDFYSILGEESPFSKCTDTSRRI